MIIINCPFCGDPLYVHKMDNTKMYVCVSCSKTKSKDYVLIRVDNNLTYTGFTINGYKIKNYIPGNNTIIIDTEDMNVIYNSSLLTWDLTSEKAIIHKINAFLLFQ